MNGYDGRADALARWQLAVRELRKEFLRNMKATEICAKAGELVGGDRDRQHGGKARGFQNIAALWNGYLAIRRDPAAPLSDVDVAHMMGLLKIARTQWGGTNDDDWLDAVGYLAIAGQLAQERP